MKNLIQFEYGNAHVRTILIDEDLWFVAMDVAAILGYSETNRMTTRLDEDEIGKIESTVLVGSVNSHARNDMTIINESGLYSAILGSSKPEAKSFKKWVTSVVLPSIRKTGQYGSVANQLPQSYGELVIEYGKVLVEREKQEALLLEHKPMLDTYHSVMSANGHVGMGDVAKIISECVDFAIGRNILMRIMRYKMIFTEFNVPYQQYMNMGLFDVVASNPNEIGLKKTTLATAKGIEFIRNLIVDMSETELAKATGSPAVTKALSKLGKGDKQ